MPLKIPKMSVTYVQRMFYILKEKISNQNMQISEL